MKQVVQHVDTGELVVADVPVPTLRSNGILIRTAASVVSAGTERTVVDFGEKNLVQKARARPDLVRDVLDKVKREGLLTTLDTVQTRLRQPIPLGYSSSGTVVAVGDLVTGFAVGDRVACAGMNYATHAEMSYVPRNLCTVLPDSVAFEEGAFATLGAIALQGIRQASVGLGDNVAVIGLGLLGLLTVQMLRAAGCQVFGIDTNPERNQRALDLGATAVALPASAEAAGAALTAGRGFDAVLITAGTPSSEPVAQAGQLARDRGVVVAVGAVGLHIPRKTYYEKELDFRLSRSYGPGRYDPEYEEKGHDYPYGFVRWTEQRNMQAFLQFVADGAVRVDPLITHRFTISAAARAYEIITGKTGEPFLGVVLQYDTASDPLQQIQVHAAPETEGAEHGAAANSLRLGIIGAGAFANATLLPAIRDIPGVELRGIVSGSGMTAQAAAERFGIRYCASAPDALFNDSSINWIAIATRHNLHAHQAVEAMRMGKDVFVEKPAAISLEELREVVATQRETQRRLIVGFNRRFAPFVCEMKQFLSGRQRPVVASYRINAGHIAADHWTQDPQEGGGRIIGEACHFIDLLQFLIGAKPVRVHATGTSAHGSVVEDEVIIHLTFADGSIGTVVYAAGGDRSFGKERIEIIGDSKVAVLDDFRLVELVANGRKSRKRALLRSDKGHRGLWLALVRSVRGGHPSPISMEEIVATHMAAFAAVESLRTAAPVAIGGASVPDTVDVDI